LTVFLTTHYMDEAENCDRIAIIDYGKIVALDTPDRLKDALGGDLVTLKAENNEAAVAELKERYHLTPAIQNGTVTFSVSHGETFLPDFLRGFNNRLLSVSLHRPTLDDVFIKLTGRAIRESEVNLKDQMKMRMRWHR
jgi:ABC-2 type transport system ATP-binding protein